MAITDAQINAAVPITQNNDASDRPKRDLTNTLLKDLRNAIDNAQNLLDYMNVAGLKTAAYMDVGSNPGEVAAGNHAHTPSEVIGLGNAAVKNVGTGPNDVASGDHEHHWTKISGLGNAATKNVGISPDTVAAGDHTHAAGTIVPDASSAVKGITFLVTTTGPDDYSPTKAATPSFVQELLSAASGGGNVLADLMAPWHQMTVPSERTINSDYTAPGTRIKSISLSLKPVPGTYTVGSETYTYAVNATIKAGADSAASPPIPHVEVASIKIYGDSSIKDNVYNLSASLPPGVTFRLELGTAGTSSITKWMETHPD